MLARLEQPVSVGGAARSVSMHAPAHMEGGHLPGPRSGPDGRVNLHSGAEACSARADPLLNQQLTHVRRENCMTKRAPIRPTIRRPARTPGRRTSPSKRGRSMSTRLTPSPRAPVSASRSRRRGHVIPALPCTPPHRRVVIRHLRWFLKVGGSAFNAMPRGRSRAIADVGPARVAGTVIRDRLPRTV